MLLRAKRVVSEATSTSMIRLLADSRLLAFVASESKANWSRELWAPLVARAFATSEIVFIKELGVGTALAVLIDATIIRALLVPALMEMLGKWNWWAPGWMRRLHQRIGLSE